MKKTYRIGRFTFSSINQVIIYSFQLPQSEKKKYRITFIAVSSGNNDINVSLTVNNQTEPVFKDLPLYLRNNPVSLPIGLTDLSTLLNTNNSVRSKISFEFSAIEGKMLRGSLRSNVASQILEIYIKAL